MAGSLKINCPTGTREWVRTVPFATLNNCTSFTFSCWLQVASIGPEATNADFAAAITSYPVTLGLANRTAFQLYAAGVTNSLSYQPALDFKGHFLVVSFKASGPTTIYVDGAPARTTASALGNSAAADQIVNAGFNAGGAAIVAYLKDVAIWRNYAATQQDVLDLREGVRTPGTLGTPATNWWTLQDPAPTGQTVTLGSPGLLDQIGGVNLSVQTGDSPTYLTYDPHTIPLAPSVRMLNPFVDTTGNLIFIPLYGDTTTTAGGPATPISINIAPVFKLNGSTITPTLVSPPYIGLYAIVYQVPSGTSAASGDTVTMSAPMGWASANFGLIEGTSAAGLGSAAMTLVNNAGAAIESIYTPTKSMKIGFDVSAQSNRNNWPGQPRANHISRCPWQVDGWSSGLTWNANGLPLTISAPSACYVYRGIGSGLPNDTVGSPNIQGLWTLAYGDSSAGVTSNPSTGHVISADLDFTAPYVVTPNPFGGDSAGSWNGSAWTGIVKTYLVTYPGTGGFGMWPRVTISSTTSTYPCNVDFPSKGNGQVELGVFPPSPTNRNVSSPTNWDPLGVDPEYLLKLAGASAVRWMPAAAGYTNSGGSTMVTVPDLDQRQVNDFLWTYQGAPFTTNITRAEPIGSTFNAIVDYQGGTQTMSGENWRACSLFSRVPVLLTTAAPHGLRTGDGFGITSTTAAPAPKVDQTGLQLAAAITVTTSPVTFTTNSVAPPLTAGQVVMIDAEQFTVTSTSGSSVTCTRPTAGTTAATHLINAVVYTNFLTGAISTTSGPTVITVPNTAGFGGIIQIDSEQMAVTAVGSSTSMTVTRAVNGTTGATHAAGAVVYPCVVIQSNTFPCFVTSPTQFVIFPLNTAVPPGSDLAAISNPTIAATVNYTTPNWPTYTKGLVNPGSVPYEFAAKTTNAIAVANGYPTICWINVGFLATDALVTEIVANRVIPYITTGNFELVVELANEIWNTSGAEFFASNILALTAPNPETTGTGFGNTGEYIASRQHHITKLAKDAFTAAGLNAARVLSLYPGQHQINPTQGTSQAIVAYCQLSSFPIDYLSPDGYVDITTDVWNLWWSWMPTGDGGMASWTRPMARRVMMSFMRAWCWFSQYFGGGILGNAQLLSWYAAGKNVAANGVGSSNANTGLGKLCYYEAATEIVSGGQEDGSHKTAAAGNFVHPNAIMHDLLNDGAAVWTGDTGWKATETAYLASMDSAAAKYAALMPSASFPDPVAGTAGFVCLFSHVGVYGGQGQCWFTYNWQGQQPGNGVLNRMTIPDATPWVAATPVEQSLWQGTVGESQSIRAQTGIEWIAATTGGGGGGGGGGSGGGASAMLMG